MCNLGIDLCGFKADVHPIINDTTKCYFPKSDDPIIGRVAGQVSSAEIQNIQKRSGIMRLDTQSNSYYEGLGILDPFLPRWYKEWQ